MVILKSIGKFHDVGASLGAEEHQGTAMPSHAPIRSVNVDSPSRLGVCTEPGAYQIYLVLRTEDFYCLPFHVTSSSHRDTLDPSKYRSSEQQKTKKGQVEV